MTVIYSIGHGNRDIDAFVGLLRSAGIQCVVDVRAYPGSRRHPQFSRLALAPVLNAGGIRYVWEGDALGGLRRSRGESPHGALDDAAFRGYADHMQSPTFRNALGRLHAAARQRPTVFMCAEANPHHCHRAFIADALRVGGTEVLHLMAQKDVRRHVMHESARIGPDGQLVYDACLQLGLAL